jgi:hypothetical protein
VSAPVCSHKCKDSRSVCLLTCTNTFISRRRLHSSASV